MTASNGNISALLAICAGYSRVNSPHKGPWRGSLMFSLICAWINVRVNNREAGELRRHQSHYDVPVILTMIRAWVVDNIHSFQWDVIAHPCPNPNGGLTKLPSVRLIYYCGDLLIRWLDFISFIWNAHPRLPETLPLTIVGKWIMNSPYSICTIMNSYINSRPSNILLIYALLFMITMLFPWHLVLKSAS